MTNTSTPTVNGKQPICNGSVNPSLTLDEALQFDDDTIISMAWSKTVSTEYAHSFGHPTQQQWIDDALATRGKLTYEEIKANPIDALRTAWERYEQVKNIVLRNRHTMQYEQGQRIHATMRELQYSAEFKLAPSQLKGFLTANGSWNNFDHLTACKCIDETEQAIPRKDYGINNCNTGGTNHQWSVQSDYIFLHSGYCTGDEFKAWQAFGKTLQSIWQKAKPDSFRHTIETTNYGQLDNIDQPCGILYIMWWD